MMTAFNENTLCEWWNFKGEWVDCKVLKVIKHSPKSFGWLIEHELGTHTVEDESYLRPTPPINEKKHAHFSNNHFINSAFIRVFVIYKTAKD